MNKLTEVIVRPMVFSVGKGSEMSVASGSDGTGMSYSYEDFDSAYEAIERAVYLKETGGYKRIFLCIYDKETRKLVYELDIKDVAAWNEQEDHSGTGSSTHE